MLMFESKQCTVHILPSYSHGFSNTPKHPQPGEPANAFVFHPDCTHCCFPQVSGRARASAKCWDTRTAAGAPRRRGPTRAWPADRTCPRSTRRLRFPGTPEGKTTIRLSYQKPTVCKACTKKSNTRNLIIFSLAHRRRPEYRKRTRCPFQSTQTLKSHQKGILSFYCTVLLIDYVGLLQCFCSMSCVFFGSYKTVHCIMCNMQDFVH